MLASHLDLGRLLAGLSHGAQCGGTCLAVVGRPPTDPLPPAGSRYAAFCTRCCLPGAARSCPLPSPPPVPRCQPGASISALKTCLGIWHGPTGIKPDQQPLTCCLCAEELMQPQQALSSGGAPRLCGSKACSWLQASLGSYLFLPPPRLAHFADHLQCRANSVLNPTISLPSSHSLA